MAGERMNDQALTNWGHGVHAKRGDDPCLCVACDVMRRACTELRERRAADLTADEVESLRYLKVASANLFSGDQYDPGMYEIRRRLARGVEALDKLLSSGGVK